MRAVVPAILEPLECPTAEVASVPRRFGVGVLMILMTAFAVLFAVMKTCGAPPEVFMVIAVLFLAVTLGQILLFQGKHPRRASAVAGAVTFPLEMLCLAIFSPGWRDNLLPDVFMFAASGALCGYVAGCVMASIFLVQERFRRRSKSPATVELLPFTAADFNTLTCWVHDQQFFHLWSQREFRYPLDCDQLAARLSLTVGEPPRRLCFKAVRGGTREMVGYVELAGFDRENLNASLRLAIVDPAADDRGQLSMALLLEIMQQAFERQGLEWLEVVLYRGAVQSRECFRRSGFYYWQDEEPLNWTAKFVRLIRSNQY